MWGMKCRDAGNDMQGCGECDVGMRWDVNGMRECGCGWQNATARMPGMQHRDAGNANAECGCRDARKANGKVKNGKITWRVWGQYHLAPADAGPEGLNGCNAYPKTRMV